MSSESSITEDTLLSSDVNHAAVSEDVALTPDATDDSCITQFIEIVPLHISRKDFPNTVQVKDEFTADIKQEPEDPCEEYGTSVANHTVCSTRNTGDWVEEVDATQSHMQPVVVLERINWTRLMEIYKIRLDEGEYSLQVKTEPATNDVAEQMLDDKQRLCVGTVTTVNDRGSCIEFERKTDRTDESLPFEIKTEADDKDIIEHQHYDKARPFCCNVCDKHFTYKGNLKRHKRAHSEQNMSTCAQCGKRFKTRDCLDKHMNIHSIKYKCAQCGNGYRDEKELKIHLRSHSGEKPFECTVCNKRFTRSDYLVVHGRIHSGEKPYKCRLCDKLFTESCHLARHLRTHTGERPHKCSLCDKRFSRSSHMERHKRFVHGNRTTNCPYCRMQFQTKSELKQHVSVCTKAPQYSCKHCSQYFARPQQLTRHLLKSHDEGTWFTCHFCQKKFCMKGDLKIHVRRHEGVKPYLCRECPKRFCSAVELKCHQAVHSDDRPFCCGNNCGRYFKQKYEVVRHFKWCSGM